MNGPEEGNTAPPPANNPLRAGGLQKTITMAQIAKAAKVSQGAISSLLNDRDYGIRVSEKTRERVFKVCRQLGYVPNDLRAVVRMYPEFGDFCLLIADDIPGGLQNPMASQVAAHLLGRVGSHSFAVGRYNSRTDYANPEQPLPDPVPTGVSSKILLLGTYNASLAEELGRRNIPTVCIGTGIHSDCAPCFGPDYDQAAELALSQLAQLGHSDPAVIVPPSDSSPEGPHIRAAAEAMVVRAGREASGLLIAPATAAGGVQALEWLRSISPRVTAVFCWAEETATGLACAAQGAGITMGRDLSIVTCSGARSCSGGELQQGLTRVELPFESLVAEAVVILEGLAAKSDFAARKALLNVPVRTFPARWMEGSTAGPHPDRAV